MGVNSRRLSIKASRAQSAITVNGREEARTAELRMRSFSLLALSCKGPNAVDNPQPQPTHNLQTSLSVEFSGRIKRNSLFIDII